MRIRFLADANLNEHIVSGVSRREPEVDFELSHTAFAAGTKDPEVLAIAAERGRILITHDSRTMPDHFSQFIEHTNSAGLILVPRRVTIAKAIDDLLLVWNASEAEEWINVFQRLPL